MKKLFLILSLFIAYSSFAQNHQDDNVHQHLDHELVFSNSIGDTIALSKLNGKVVFINIWAVWCGPCRDELPGLNDLFLKYENNDKVQFLFVDADSDLKKSQKFLNKRNFKIPLYKSENGFPASLYRGAVPTTMVFDREGKLVMHYEGAADYTNQNFLKAFDDFVNK